MITVNEKAFNQLIDEDLKWLRKQPKSLERIHIETILLRSSEWRKQSVKWVRTSEKLPEEGKYVLARHTRGTWHDSTDQENVNCVVVKLVKGITQEERLSLPDNDPRKKQYKQGDVHSNNRVPYCWEMFGPDMFFGQDIEEWIYIPK